MESLWHLDSGERSRTGVSAPHLFTQVSVKERRHELVCLFGLGESGIVPEGVREGFEDYQVRLIAGSEIGSVEDRRTT